LIKLGDLGQVPVPHADTVPIHFLHKTEEGREKAVVQIRQKRDC